MQTPIKVIKLFSFVMFFLIVSLSITQAQHPNTTSEETKRGIEFYNEGKDKEAIDALKKATKKNKDDIEAWHYLGLAFERVGKKKDASKAYDNAAKWGFEIFVRQMELNSEERKQALSKLKTQFEFAYKSAVRYLSINPNLKTKKREEWESRVIILKGFAEYTADASEISKGIYKSTEVTTKARITYNPQPEYTEEARKNQVSGVIRIQMILGADGNIYAIIPLNGLPNGLTEKAIKAAKQIKFIPAIKDGQPVSQWVTIEYSFRVY